MSLTYQKACEPLESIYIPRAAFLFIHLFVQLEETNNRLFLACLIFAMSWIALSSFLG